MENKKRLICLDDLIKIMRAEDKRYPNVPWSTTAVARLCEPMVLDAVEVVHGSWETGRHCYECSVCKNGYIGLPKTKYCPNCGAKMDLEG